MSDSILFMFGLIATLLAIGPLTLAAVLDMRSRSADKDQG